MPTFKALDKKLKPIVTVIAENIDDATDQIMDQLTRNPSRMVLFKKWAKDGKIVRGEAYTDVLNENEIKVLKSLVDSSEGSGHDFGFTDEYEDCGFTKHQMAGYIGQLSKKGYIDLYAPEGVVSDGPIDYMQFVFTEKAALFLGIEL